MFLWILSVYEWKLKRKLIFANGIKKLVKMRPYFWADSSSQHDRNLHDQDELKIELGLGVIKIKINLVSIVCKWLKFKFHKNHHL